MNTPKDIDKTTNMPQKSLVMTLLLLLSACDSEAGKKPVNTLTKEQQKEVEAICDSMTTDQKEEIDTLYPFVDDKPIELMNIGKLLQENIGKRLKDKNPE